MITPDEQLNTKIILPNILFIWFNFLLMSLTDNLLINLKINGSYHNYELAIEDNRQFIESQNRHSRNNQKEQTIQTSDSKHNTQNAGEYNIQVMNNNNDINTNNIMNNIDAPGPVLGQESLHNNHVGNNTVIQNNLNTINNIRGSTIFFISNDNNQKANLTKYEE